MSQKQNTDEIEEINMDVAQAEGDREETRGDKTQDNLELETQGAPSTQKDIGSAQEGRKEVNKNQEENALAVEMRQIAVVLGGVAARLMKATANPGVCQALPAVTSGDAGALQGPSIPQERRLEVTEAENRILRAPSLTPGAELEVLNDHSIQASERGRQGTSLHREHQGESSNVTKATPDVPKEESQRMSEEGSDNQIRWAHQVKMPLPAPTLPTFSGQDSKEYWRFQRAFRRFIGATKVPETYKMHALLEACKDESLKDTLEQCDRFGPIEGYKKALAILDRRFGKETSFIDELVTQLTHGPQIKPGDIKGLRKLADDAFTCGSTLEVLERQGELDNRTTIKAIANRLTGKTRERYRQKALAYAEKHEGTPPNFEWMQTFLRRVADRATIEEQPSWLNDAKVREGTSADLQEGSTSQKATSFATIDEGETEEHEKGELQPLRDSSLHRQERSSSRIRRGTHSSPPRERGTHGHEREAYRTQRQKCPLCSDSHNLPGCNKFRAMSIPERVAVVRRMRCCFVCLRNNHFWQECRLRDRVCDIGGCRERHSRWLHRPDSKGGEQEPTSSRKRARTEEVEEKNSRRRYEPEAERHFTPRIKKEDQYRS